MSSACQEDTAAPLLCEDAVLPLAARVTVIVQSEFGRRVRQNGSGGTDHGYGNPLLVLLDEFSAIIETEPVDLLLKAFSKRAVTSMCSRPAARSASPPGKWRHICALKSPAATG